MRSTLAALGVAALLVVAGCAGILGSGGSTTAAGPNATTGGPGPGGGTNTLGEDVERPPGVFANGSVNETRLLSAHSEAVGASVYRDAMRIDQGSAGGSSFERIAGPDAVLQRVVSREGRRTCWRSGNEAFQYRPGGSPAVAYAHNDTGPVSDCGYTASFSLQYFLRAGEFYANGTVTRGGERLVRLSAAEPGDTRFGSFFESYRATALVDADGVIRSLTGRAVATSEGERVPTAFEYGVDRSVESVPLPAWTAGVPRGDADLTADGRALALSVSAGSIPAGTELRLVADRTYSATADRAVEAGETVYLLVVETDRGRELRIAREGPDATGAVDLSGRGLLVRGTVGNATVAYAAGSP